MLGSRRPTHLAGWIAQAALVAVEQVGIDPVGPTHVDRELLDEPAGLTPKSLLSAHPVFDQLNDRIHTLSAGSNVCWWLEPKRQTRSSRRFAAVRPPACVSMPTAPRLPAGPRHRRSYCRPRGDEPENHLFTAGLVVDSYRHRTVLIRWGVLLGRRPRCRRWRLTALLVVTAVIPSPMPKSIAINVAANTNLPGVRGPIYPDGRFVYLPIPEREPIAADVPTYGDLRSELDPLPFDLPADVLSQPVHLDPAFTSYPFCSTFTYGDEHAVKAGPLSTLSPGDSLFFYATLSTHDRPAEVDTAGADTAVGERVDWVAPEWGAYLIGEFRVADVLDAEQCASVSPSNSVVAENAHAARREFDAKVVVRGGPRSQLFEHAVPLSAADSGATANRLVTELSNDSGRGPWWRRRLWFEADETARLREIVDDDPENRGE